MDQQKIGKFILEERKRKGYTQKQLADILSVSDKTISKWENGNGIPDVSLLLPLCEELDISVNELLSGERIPEKEYKSKAEENMVSLVKGAQKMNNRKIKSLWDSVSKIYLSVAVVLLAVTLVCLFLNADALAPMAINALVWMILGGVAGMLYVAESSKLKKLKATGKAYDAEIVDILPSALFRVGNYVTCRVKCMYILNGQEHTVNSGYVLLTHFDRREDLKAVVYQRENNDRCRIELFRKN